MQVSVINWRRSSMKPTERIALLCVLMAVVDACASDKHLVGPGGAKPLAADLAAEDSPAYGSWGPPVNLGSVINSSYNENSPAISRDGLSLYFTSSPLPLPPGARPGGRGGGDIWVPHRASTHTPSCPPGVLGPNITTPADQGVSRPSPARRPMSFPHTHRRGLRAADLWA